MWARVNGVRLFFDVEGASLVPDGPSMREKPTVVLLHGGPGLDHSIYKPSFSSLADIAQVIFLDHRGNGRSEPGPQETWTLAQWGDGVRAFEGDVTTPSAARRRNRSRWWSARAARACRCRACGRRRRRRSGRLLLAQVDV